MAKSAQATGALLSTVTNAANMVSNTFKTLDDTVGMANSFVSRHKIQQDDKNVVELANSRVRLVEDTALEMAEHRSEIAKKLGDTPDFKTYYNESLASLQALFTEAA